jgi:hypothetical protein
VAFGEWHAKTSVVKATASWSLRLRLSARDMPPAKKKDVRPPP